MHLKLVCIKYSETGGSMCYHNVSKTEMTCQIGLLIITIWVTAGQEPAVHWVSRVLINTGNWVSIRLRSIAGAQPNHLSQVEFQAILVSDPLLGTQQGHRPGSSACVSCWSLCLAYDFILLFS